MSRLALEIPGIKPVAAQVAGTSGFTLLDDQPYASDHDPLMFEQIARDLSALIRASRASTPLTLGIEGGWGAGKSTLMRRLERVLATHEQVTTVWFNAWTANEGNALEGIVKSVLDRLDRNILRRAARNERLLSWARALGLMVADWLRLGSLVNTLWREVSVDPKSRNEIRGLVVKSMREWASVRANLGPERLLIVFVDDLDRCPPVNVLQVFEAIKLYLDAPGLVFVVGYDRDIISDAILDVRQFSDTITSHHYLEKIVQIVYRLPGVSDEGTQKLLDLYLEGSRTNELFDSSARALTIEQNARNPRRIKRFINSFILEYGLDSEWEHMGPETLVRVLIIDAYFPDFGRLLRARSQRDPVKDFNEYVAVRSILRRGRPDDSKAAQVEEAFESRGLAAPSGEPETILDTLERELPPSFPKLAQNDEFIALLEGLDDVARLREKLRRYSPTTVRRLPPQGRVFLMYRREDSGAYVRRLSDALADHFGPDRLFLDVQTIVPGADWHQAIETAIREAPVVLAVIGPSWAGPWLDSADNWLYRELALALARPGARVIPVLVGGAELPTSEQLPEELIPLVDRQGAILTDSNWEQDVGRLIDTIEYWYATPTMSGMLELQAAMQRENAKFAAISAVLAERHQGVKDTIAQIR